MKLSTQASSHSLWEADGLRSCRAPAHSAQAFPTVPQAVAWKELFSADRPRYPFLLVRGRSHTGKTEWAKSLFAKPLTLHVGWLEHFPDKMRKFDRAVYDGIILDDIRDLKFLHLHQEKVQGKYDDVIEFASAPGGQCAFERWLSKVPPGCHSKLFNLQLKQACDK